MTTVPERNPAAACTAMLRGVRQCNYHATGGTDAWCSARVFSAGLVVRFTPTSAPAGTFRGLPGPYETDEPLGRAERNRVPLSAFERVRERALAFVRELAAERCEVIPGGSCVSVVCAPCRARRVLDA